MTIFLRDLKLFEKEQKRNKKCESYCNDANVQNIDKLQHSDWYCSNCALTSDFPDGNILLPRRWLKPELIDAIFKNLKLIL